INNGVSIDVEPEATVTATLSDEAGNTSITVTENLGDTLTVDTEIATPTITVTGDTNNDGVLNQNELNEDGTVSVTIGVTGSEVGDTLTYTVDGAETTVVLTQEDINNGVSIDVEPEATVTATLSDEAGNTSITVTENLGDTLTVDTKVETPVITNITDAEGDYTNVTLHGTGTPGETITLYAISNSTTGGNETQTGQYVAIATASPIIVAADGSWSVDISNLDDVPLNDNEFFKATQTDAAGNESDFSNTVHYWHGEWENIATEAGDDFVFAGEGDDTLYVNADDANDYLVLDGGQGDDTVSFAGKAEDYVVTTNSKDETVVVSLDGSGDVTVLRNVENIVFADEPDTVIDTANHVVTGVNETQTVTISADSAQAVTFSTNLVLTFDVSWSMNDKVTVDGKQTTRFDMAKQATINMIESYKAQGETDVNLTLFGKTSVNVGWMNADDAISYLNSLKLVSSSRVDDANGKINNLDPAGTNYEAAIAKTVGESFEEHNADRTLAFFLSDGDPTVEMSNSGTAKVTSLNKNDITNDNVYNGTVMKFVDKDYFDAWDQFIDSNNIHLNVIGVGSGISDAGINYLNMMASAYEGGSANVVSDNADDLAAAFVPKEQMIVGNILGNFDFGDETGSITSITVEGTTYTVDTFPTQGVTTLEGSKLTFNFETGNYTYTVTVSDVSRDFSEIFQVSATDENGDVATVDLKINVDDTRTFAPNVPTIETVTDADDGNVNSVRVSGNGTPNSIVTLFIAGETVGTANVESDGTWSYELSVTDGLYALSAQATLSGESSSVSEVSTISINNGSVTGTSEADYLVGVQSARGGDGDDYMVGTSGNDTLLGENGNDTIFGGAGNDFIDGGAGDDYIDGGAGADYILAGSGDDTIVFDAQDRMIDGGTGYDTLLIKGDQEIDFSGLSEHISNIETIKLGEGKQDVTLTLEDVLSMTDDAHTLRIDGDADDTVHLLEQGEWKLGDSIVEGENSYNVYTAESGDATVTLQINTQVHTEES
ncbi:MAG: hypothetical protein WC163_11655, partial [Sulfurovum sp.]